MVKVKVCGITNLEDALTAFIYQADAIGFVFYRKSSRFISVKKAAAISKILPSRILKVGVFVNTPKEKVKTIARTCGLDMLQFHGKESPDYCQSFKKYKVIKAFRVNKEIDWQKVFSYKTFAYLFDTFSLSQAGGTGKKFNWNLLKGKDKIKAKVFLAGGLNLKNIKEAIRKIRPDWVDVSSAVELSAGKKDKRKIKLFIQKVKNL